MATARKKTKVVETVESVTLVLSIEEAETLHAITWRTGGDPVRSRRKHVDSIRVALADAGSIGHDTSDIATVGIDFKDTVVL